MSNVSSNRAMIYVWSVFTNSRYSFRIYFRMETLSSFPAFNRKRLSSRNVVNICAKVNSIHFQGQRMGLLSARQSFEGCFQIPVLVHHTLFQMSVSWDNEGKSEYAGKSNERNGSYWLLEDAPGEWPSPCLDMVEDWNWTAGDVSASSLHCRIDRKCLAEELNGIGPTRIERV